MLPYIKTKTVLSYEFGNYNWDVMGAQVDLVGIKSRWDVSYFFFTRDKKLFRTITAKRRAKDVHWVYNRCFLMYLIILVLSQRVMGNVVTMRG